MNSFNLDKLIRNQIKTMKPYRSARDEFSTSSDDFLFLDANENPIESKVNRYPDPYQTELKTILAEKQQVAINQILLGNGSDEVLDLIFRAFCEPNQDKVLTLPPTYGMYQVLADLNAVQTIKVPLTDDFQPDVPSILDQIDAQTKLLFVCSPNNPTGNQIAKERITLLLDAFDGLVVIDEAYIDFASDGSWTAFLDRYPNLIVTQTLSKAYGMAGVRIGVCYASAEIISVLNAIKPPYNINSLSIQYACDALKKTTTIKAQIDMIIDERTKLQAVLNSVAFIDKVYDSEANFLLIKVDNANLRYQQLINHQVVIRNRSTQEKCEQCLRISVGTPEQNKQLINTLNQLTNA